MIGPGGAGKTTLARAMADWTGLPLIHLDVHSRRRGWKPTPAVEWTELTRRPEWIMDGNYGGPRRADSANPVRPFLGARAPQKVRGDAVDGFARVEAVTLDFYNTLVYHRDGRGRGRLLIEYLEAQGFRPAPWEHQVLYDVFQSHDAEYAPQAPPEVRDEYYRRLASRVFGRLDVATSDGDAARHAASMWDILGPACLGVFSDVRSTLGRLAASGYRLALISNWQRGLRHFCTELRLAEHFEHILGSADLGVAKPDRRIFAEACRRLGVTPDRVLHVGDTLEDDYRGGQAAGLSVVLLEREPSSDPRVARLIRSLDELLEMLPPRSRHAPNRSK